MLKNTMQHPDAEIRQTSQRVLNVLYERFGIEGVSSMLKQLHPQVLQQLKTYIPETEQIIKESQGKAQSAQVYNTTGAQGWLPSLKSQKTQQSIGQRKLYGTKSKAKLATESEKKGEVELKNDDIAHLVTGQTSDLEDQKQQLVECQFCGVQSVEFADGEKLDLHYVLQCLMLTNCAGCTQIIEVSSYTDHKLNQCKHEYKQCPRCKEAIEADFYEQHTKSLTCVPANNQLRCPLCHKDLVQGPGESEEKVWQRHLVTEKCPQANVRISTNAKARISILRAKQPPASEVIMEEDDEEDDFETNVVGSTTKGGRVTVQSRRGSQINGDAESRKSSSFKNKSAMERSHPDSPGVLQQQ